MSAPLRHRLAGFRVTLRQMLRPRVTGRYPYEKRPKPDFLPSAKDPQLPGYASLDEGNVSGYGEIASVERTTTPKAAKVVAVNESASKFPWGVERNWEKFTHETQDEHPETTSILGEHRTTVELEDRKLTWEGRLSFRSDLKYFYYTYTRRLLKDGELLREKAWEDTIPRDHQ